MKNTILAILASFAFFLLAACQKEEPASVQNTQKLRTITCVFENNSETKTILSENGVTPLWNMGDTIRILNASTYQDIILKTENIKSNGQVFVVETNLEGNDLYAVYPASATTMQKCSGTMSYIIPPVQGGTFATANICLAKFDENEGMLIFKNATSVLEFTQNQSGEVLNVKFISSEPIAGELTATFDNEGKLSINKDSLSYCIVKTMPVWWAKTNVISEKYYLAVAPIESTGPASFEFCQKLKVAKLVNNTGKKLEMNKIYPYSMDDRRYVIKKDEIGSHKYVQIGCTKWATLNLGVKEDNATGVGLYGNYYMWGETVGSYKSGPNSVKREGSNVTPTFAWSNAPFNGGFNEFSQDAFNAVKNDCYPSTSWYPKAALSLEYDAAFQSWGDSWRMPIGGFYGEFRSLYKATYMEWDDTDQGIYVYEPKDDGDVENFGKAVSGTYNKEDALLFFPAAGYVSAPSWLGNQGNLCSYMSSSLLKYPQDDCAFFLYYVNKKFEPGQGIIRAQGYSIRPVSD